MHSHSMCVCVWGGGGGGGGVTSQKCFQSGSSETMGKVTNEYFIDHVQSLHHAMGHNIIAASMHTTYI